MSGGVFVKHGSACELSQDPHTAKSVEATLELIKWASDRGPDLGIDAVLSGFSNAFLQIVHAADAHEVAIVGIGQMIELLRHPERIKGGPAEMMRKMAGPGAGQPQSTGAGKEADGMSPVVRAVGAAMDIVTPGIESATRQHGWIATVEAVVRTIVGQHVYSTVKRPDEHRQFAACCLLAGVLDLIVAKPVDPACQDEIERAVRALTTALGMPLSFADLRPAASAARH